MDEINPRMANTWKKAREIRESLQRVDENCSPAMEMLESVWGEKIHPFLEEMHFKRNEDERFADNPVAAMLLYLEMGLYPPPEILLTIAESFNAYMKGHGQLSLEEVFFGTPVKKLGNHAARELHDSVLSQLEFRLLCNAGNGPKSQIDIAEALIQEFNLAVDAETLLRNYRRRKKYGQLKADK